MDAIQKGKSMVSSESNSAIGCTIRMRQRSAYPIGMSLKLKECNRMTKKSIFRILMLLLFIHVCGCSTTKYYGRYKTDKVAVGDKIIVTMINEETYTITLSEIAYDGISGTTDLAQASSESTIVIPIDSIKTIQVKKPGISESFVAVVIVSGMLWYFGQHILGF
jgi:hypothetical protein